MPDLDNPVVDRTRGIAILGAGAAGIAAAEALREFGYEEAISLISDEADAPYDRTALSKDFLTADTPEPDVSLHPETFYSENQIERMHARAAGISPEERSIEFEDGRVLGFDQLLVATGGIPRSLELPGAGLGNIFVLRTLGDARKIVRALRPGMRTVVIGGSFIALEVASCFAARKIPVMVIAPEKAPFAHTFGAEVGRGLGHWHERHGVEFRLGHKIERIAGTGMVREVVLQSGERIPADLIVVGGGVRPATDALYALPLLEDGSVPVDRYLRAAPGIYAAGDIATYPDPHTGKPLRIEHWRTAQQHGRTAAANMLGRKVEFDGVPYFWTTHFGTRFDYVGHAPTWDEVVIEGSFDKPEFLACYVAGERVKAAAACGFDEEMAELEKSLASGGVQERRLSSATYSSSR